MVYFPARKCYHAAKVAILVLFAVAVLALFEQWRGGKRGTVAYSNPEEAEFERQILEDEARIVPGLGEGGVAAYLTGEDKKRGEESEKKLAMNVYLSDRIAYNRTLKDHRNPACKRVIYDAELPSASVILIFHNEPYSVVVRTIWSVINSCRRSNKWFRQANFVDRNGRNMQLGYPGQDPNSPLVYLKEIILVDDNSTLPELKGKLSHYVRTRLPPDLIRILRLPDRSIAGARHSGAVQSSGEVLIFLDSHCEASPDWLRPLLQRCKQERTAVLVPLIDVIGTKQFVYRHMQQFKGPVRPRRRYLYAVSTEIDIHSVGLTRARLAGARYAAADVLVFLDSHCEAQLDWLRPQLQAIKDAPHAVTVPIIDVIDSSNFYYSVQDPVTFQGLMLARIAGARVARGEALVFLDAHCEGGADWLRPLLQRLRHKRDAVLTPVIDVIDQTAFHIEAADSFQVGGFTFTGHFTWIDIPSREKKRRGSDIAPTWSPTMAGGLFAINRAYYWELGAYDEQMAGWGGENLEMSFRIWQCGGTLETIPCSRVGHVFRSFHPYGLPEHTDTHGINTARMAEVWMDEYAELFYLHRPDLRNNPKIGDVTHRKVLREKLQCKSFQWYLDNIYKEKFVPVRDAYGYGRFQNPSTGLCLDTLQREAEEAALGLYQCHSELQATQYLILSLENELRTEDDCAHAQYKPRASREHSTGRRVLMSTCRGKGSERKFMYNPATQQIQYDEGYCLDASPGPAEDVLLRPCSNSPSQKWRIDYSEDNDFKMSNEIEPNEQQVKLSRLRGQKRISRSLLSYSAGNATVRRHTHKKRRKHSRNKKTKNKFILKLVRSLTNHSEEHLEVDIHCKHRQLYPNNTLVRDLVTILNDNHIKVINNGRVFERNKVTQLTREGANAQRVLNKMDIASQQAPPPIQAIDQKPPAQQATFSLLKKGRSKVKQPPQLQPLGAGGAPPPAPPAPAPGAEARAHRIIIEDFVELTPANTMRPKRMKKRKRKHPKAAPATQPPEAAPPEEAPAEAPRANDAPEDEPMIDAPMVFEERPPAESSIEDAAMVMSGAERGGAIARAAEGERWDVGESRYRRNNTGWRRQRPEEPDTPAEGYAADEPVVRAQSAEGEGGAEGAGGAEGEAPVKVVMRSNLTFNLGDEFFQWQHKDDREYTPRANDLSIPGAEEGRSPPPLHAWRLPEKPSPRAPHRQREDRKESGVRNELSRRDRDSEDDSSASDTYSSGD